jgi:hypothetical protein
MNLAISTFFSLTSGRVNTLKIHRFLAKRRPLEKPWKEASRERDEAVNQAGKQAGGQSGGSSLSLGPTSARGHRHYVLFLRQNGPCLTLPKVEIQFTV